MALGVVALCATLAGCPELPADVGGDRTDEVTATDRAAAFGVPPDRGLVARRLIRDVGLMKPSEDGIVVSSVEMSGIEVRYLLHRPEDLPDGAPVGRLILEPSAMGSPGAARTASFAVRTDNPDNHPAVERLLARLQTSVATHDAGGFYIVDASLRVDAAPNAEAPSPTERLGALARSETQSLATFGLLLLWALGLWWSLRRRSLHLRPEVDFKPTHLLPALLQIAFLTYWGFYFAGVGEHLPYLLAQVAFAYAFDALLSASRNDGHFKIGAGVLPVVGSANLFVWYGGTDAWLGYVTVALAIASKTFIQRDGRHILNPSGFGVAVTGLLCLLMPSTFGFFDISHQFNAGPSMLEVIFLLALIAELRVPVVLASIGALVGLVLTVDTQLLVQPTPLWGPVFLAIALLVTDPATMPRRPLGKLLFGLAYGVSVAILSTALGAAGESDFFGKVLTIPLLNLAVPWFDRAGERWQPSLLERKFNTLHVAAWVTLVVTLLFTTDAKRGGLEHNRFDPIASPRVVSGPDGRATCSDNPTWCQPFSFGQEAALWSASTPPGAPPPLHRSTTGLALILALAFLLLLVDLPTAMADLGVTGRSGRRILAWLVTITAAAAAARVLLPATFIREAHPLLSIPLQLDAPLLGLPIDLYPQGPQLMAAVFRPFLPADPYAAWFIANKTLGVLGIPAMFALAAAATRNPRTGLVAAALLALWPQHVRVSASESVHVSLMLWATIGFAWTLLAARTGRLRALLVAAAAFCACITTRPEGALWAMAAVPAALFAGPGVRTLLRRPATWAPLLLMAALVLPMLLEMVGSASATKFSPTSGARESVGISGIWTGLVSLVAPDGRNAFFDAATTPIWLWPLALGGAFMAARRGQWALVSSAGIAVFGYLVLYAHMGPAGSVWPMARYHAAALPAVCLLTTLGLLSVMHRVGLATRAIVPAAAALALLGFGLWAPSLRSVEMDWQHELSWWIDMSRRPSPVIGPQSLIVTPDNRRRFLDLTPRDAIEPLTRGAQHSGQAWTVAHALEHLHPEREGSPAYFYGGLYCWLATTADERVNPQCEAMHETFDLEPVEQLVIHEGIYLAGYQAVRAAGPIDIAIYRVRSRRLDPAAALRLLPRPIALGASGHELPMGAGAADQMGPPQDN